MAPRSNAFGLDLLEGVGGVFTTSAGGLSTSMVVVLLLFINERLIGVTQAKTMFAIGYFISLMLFYTIAAVCFPKSAGNGGNGEDESAGGGDDEDDDDGEDEGDGDGDGDTGGDRYAIMSSSTRRQLQSLIPFTKSTTASFYCFSIGYLFGYWANLNMAKRTPNAVANVLIYLALTFVLVLFNVFVLKDAGWQAAMMSVCTGLIFGMVWSQMAAAKISESNAGGVVDAGAPGAGGRDRRDGAIKCDSENQDMLCNVFRA